jgi:CTP synthase
VLLENQKLLETVSGILQLDKLPKPKELVSRGKLIWQEWLELATRQDHGFETVSIALVGKYTNLHDAYMSVTKSLEHAAMHCKKKLNLIWVDSSHLEDAALETSQAEYHKAWHDVCMADGILVPGGFGVRGTEGMIKATTYARTKKVPFLGICLGMQLAVVEYARNVCGMPGAGSEELQENCEDRVIVYMPEVYTLSAPVLDLQPLMKFIG